MITIACVYKPGSGFTDEYVGRLKENVAANCKAEYRFLCLTDSRLSGIETLPLVDRRYGYWNKLELFRPGIFEGPVVYFDLDTIIVDDITEIVTHPHTFTALMNFKAKHGRSLASGFLAFDGREDYGYLLDEYTNQTPTDYEQDWARWGDQGFIQDHLRCDWDALQELWPGSAVSYKWDVRRQGKVPPDTKIVAFHGKPRPHEVNWRLPNGD